MKALVTGATGFVGANLVRRLIWAGHEVHLLLRPEHDPWRISGVPAKHLRLHELDMLDAGSLDSAIARIKPEYVFHLAAYGPYSSQKDVPRILETNLLATANLARACAAAGCEVFVNTGSSSEYGFMERPAREDDALDPRSFYAVGKAAATMFCRQLARETGLRIPTLRLFSVYGPWEEPTRLIPALICRGLKGELPPLVDPDISHDFVYVDDVVDAYLLAAKNPASEPGAVFNVGTGTLTTIRQAVEVARRVLGVGPEPVWGSMANRVWDSVQHLWMADRSKIERELSWRPRHNFETGFQATVDWLKGEPAVAARYGL